MKSDIRLRLLVVFLVAAAGLFAACGSRPGNAAAPSGEAGEAGGVTVSEDAEYTGRDEVALYLHEYGHLPPNYITKKEAQALGWEGGGEALAELAPGKSIGGSRFGNYEGQLPEWEGRRYYECDIDFDGRSRGAKRLVYSNDGLIFYTEDHYASFEQLYGEDEENGEAAAAP